jgi:hypothetical protein
VFFNFFTPELVKFWHSVVRLLAVTNFDRAWHSKIMYIFWDYALIQACRHWYITAKVQVHFHYSPCMIVVGKVAIRFSCKHFCFYLPTSIPPVRHTQMSLSLENAVGSATMSVSQLKRDCCPVTCWTRICVQKGGESCCCLVTNLCCRSVIGKLSSALGSHLNEFETDFSCYCRYSENQMNWKC